MVVLVVAVVVVAASFQVVVAVVEVQEPFELVVDQADEAVEDSSSSFGAVVVVVAFVEFVVVELVVGMDCIVVALQVAEEPYLAVVGFASFADSCPWQLVGPYLAEAVVA